jgi:hypothetical protein
MAMGIPITVTTGPIGTTGLIVLIGTTGLIVTTDRIRTIALIIMGLDITVVGNEVM